MVRALCLASVLAAGCLVRAALAAGSSCVSCHMNLGEAQAKIIRDFQGDIHHEAGLSCHSCHGGDPKTEDMALSMSPDAGFVGKPGPTDMPRFCGKCHSSPAVMKKYNPALPVDQESKFWTSHHGMELKKGNAKVAQCASCHLPHSIRKAGDPLSSVHSKNVAATCAHCHSDKEHMKGSGLPVNQFDKYMKSVHAGALYKKGDIGAPTCNDCHGNHGAQPPGVESIAMICGSCHAHNMELFNGSLMAKAWKKRGYHACATCHQHHDILQPNLDMLSGKGSVCLECHTPQHKGYQAGAAMKRGIEEGDAVYSEVTRFIDEVEQKKGMDVAEARDDIQEGRQALIQARTAVHGFDAGKVGEIASSARNALEKARTFGQKAAREFWRRRVGLGLSTLFITLVVAGILLKLRDIEK
ncbi:MAG: hypothetical protein A2902_06945 [Elusimicrobia bacterium RIFCSPLOWO2_01_FULL_64_13]|nr:MAG: hypothetical protein A2636_04170 [Elusimicrobia bacterium RIFCSPHIGHO2_01_FULL_64_10]OGR97470.1 MAG: hypothetical protein A2902_06945 [Elusimicrobia bacterium RIFCSPLOWO2_01_FULL_64_13]